MVCSISKTTTQDTHSIESAGRILSKMSKVQLKASTNQCRAGAFWMHLMHFGVQLQAFQTQKRGPKKNPISPLVLKIAKHLIEWWSNGQVKKAATFRADVKFSHCGKYMELKNIEHYSSTVCLEWANTHVLFASMLRVQSQYSTLWHISLELLALSL